MTDLASKIISPTWKVIQRESKSSCAFEHVSGTSITIVDFGQNGSVLPVGFGYLDALLDELEGDATLASDLALARKEIGAKKIEAGQVTIASLRLAKGMSQSDLANALGTSQAAVSRLEAGQQEPRLQTLRRIADALDIDLNTVGAAFAV